jgi:hypothetical protein
VCEQRWAYRMMRQGWGTYDGLEVLLLMLVVLVAEVDELLLEGVLKLLERLDGLVLGGVGGREFNGLCGGLFVEILVSFWYLLIMLRELVAFAPLSGAVTL